MLNILNEYSGQIKLYLQLFLDEKGRNSDSINKWGLDVAGRIKNFSISGKMIRGSLVLFTENMYGKKNSDDSIKLASAVELFHSGLLIHDDIIDRDELRRGSPSIHYQYKLKGENENILDPHQFGLSMGICAGDIGFFIGFELLSLMDVKKTIKDKILQLFSREFTSVGLGQMQDIYFGESAEKPLEDDILKLYLYKTARYTFSLPFMLGGLLADINADELEKLEKLGEYLGIIFQLKDDELGLFGELNNFGKPIGSDIEKEKKTLFYLYLFQYASVKEKEHLKLVFGTSGISSESVKYVQELIIKYNIKHIIEEKLNNYKISAEKVISSLDPGNKQKDILKQFVIYNFNRKK